MALLFRKLALAAGVLALTGCSSMLGGNLVEDGKPVGRITLANTSGIAINVVTISRCSAMSHGTQCPERRRLHPERRGAQLDGQRRVLGCRCRAHRQLQRRTVQLERGLYQGPGAGRRHGRGAVHGSGRRLSQARSDLPDGGERLVHRGPLWRWTTTAAPAVWHFVTVDGAAGETLSATALMRRLEGGARGFGSLKVTATIGSSTFSTSVFPSKELGWLLPVKASVRKAEAIAEGDEVELLLEV